MRGTVVAWVPEGGSLAEHERVALSGIARRIAQLAGYGTVEPGEALPAGTGHRYFVPSRTLTWEEASALGIQGPQDIFGGVVSHAHVATKAIAHPLVASGAQAVPGWNDDFPHQVRDLVLPGFTAFAASDALQAGRRLLSRGAVRIKPILAKGGGGQRVVRDAAALEIALAQLDQAGTVGQGVVLEENLDELRTFSVGRLLVAGMEASYFGWQKTTTNHRGNEVFGGSELVVARGGFGELLALQPDARLREAIRLAARFDEATLRWLPGLLATRRNYDVLVGRDAAGLERSAVLEQSWRIGGASGPEIAALETFQSQPGRRVVRASCHEIYGDEPRPPPEASVYYDGRDPQVGRLIKYTVVHPDDDTN